MKRIAMLTLVLFFLLTALTVVMARPEKCNPQKWGLWLTEQRVAFDDALKECVSMGLQLVPIQLNDIDDHMNPVRRYMANRVMEQCDVKSFWIDSGLFMSGGVIIQELDKTVKHQALCHEDFIDHPFHAPPAQSVFFTLTQTHVGTFTRTFDLDVTLTQTLPPPQPSITEYESVDRTVTEWTTQTFSIPTTIVHGGDIHWVTTTERQIVVESEAVGQTTMTTNKTITITTSVIAVVNQALTVTKTIKCPDKVTTMIPFTESSITTATEPALQEDLTTTVLKRQLICNRFSSLSAIKICDQYDDYDDEADGHLVLINNQVNFMDAECTCNAIGMRLADLSLERQKNIARKVLRACSDLPSQMAWARKTTSSSFNARHQDAVEVCMAIGRSSSLDDGPIACIQELPIFCE